MTTYELRTEGGWQSRIGRDPDADGRVMAFRLTDPSSRSTILDIEIPMEAMMDLLTNAQRRSGALATVRVVAGFDVVGMRCDIAEVVVHQSAISTYRPDEGYHKGSTMIRLTPALATALIAEGWRWDELYNGHRRRKLDYYELSMSRLVDPAAEHPIVGLQSIVAPPLVKSAMARPVDSERWVPHDFDALPVDTDSEEG